MSVKNIFKGCHDREWWLNNLNEEPAVNNAELSSLICTAGRADVETLKPLLPHADFHSVTTALETRGTALLNILIEAPLADTSMAAAEPECTSATVQRTDDEKTTTGAGYGVAGDTLAPPLPGVLNKDSASLSCLQALSDFNESRFEYYQDTISILLVY